MLLIKNPQFLSNGYETFCENNNLMGSKIHNVSAWSAKNSLIAYFNAIAIFYYHYVFLFFPANNEVLNTKITPSNILKFIKKQIGHYGLNE